MVSRQVAEVEGMWSGSCYGSWYYGLPCCHTVNGEQMMKDHHHIQENARQQVEFCVARIDLVQI